MSLQLGRQIFGEPANARNVLTPEQTGALLNDWVLNERLKLHMVQVGGLMGAWASEVEKLNEEDCWRWKMAGLLHDADWDQWPDQHCKKIIEHLEQLQIDPEVIHAIASHGPVHFGVDPITKMDKMLYAFDELSGLMHAYSLMRPNGYEGMERKGAMKRIREKTFAANVSRDDIRDACERAGISLETLVDFIIAHQAGFTSL